VKSTLTLLAALLAAAPAASPAQSKGGKGTTRHVFVRVVDERGGPVTDLTAADFTLSEQDVPRVVTHAAPARDPMRVALFLDTSDAAAPALSSMRTAAIGFLDALPAEDEVLLVTTGRQARVRVPPTTDRKKLKDTAAGLFIDGAGTVLMDGLMEVDDRFFRKAADVWPVFVFFTSDGTESSAGAREKEFEKWAVGIAGRGITVHAFVFKTPKGTAIADVIAQNLTQNTGGRFDMMNTTNALPDKMRALAEQMALDHQRMTAWYRVDFQSDSTDFRPVNVGVARSGVRLEISDRRRTQ